MTKYYELATTRMYSAELIRAWAKGEENLGLKNSFFIMENGVVKQYVDCEEGEKFFELLKKNLKIDTYFPLVCLKFFKAIEEKDKVKMFEGLCIFNEIDEHPEIADPLILKRLKRVREETHNIIYDLK